MRRWSDRPSNTRAKGNGRTPCPGTYLSEEVAFTETSARTHDNQLDDAGTANRTQRFTGLCEPRAGACGPLSHDDPARVEAKQPGPVLAQRVAPARVPALAGLCDARCAGLA